MLTSFTPITSQSSFAASLSIMVTVPCVGELLVPPSAELELLEQPEDSARASIDITMQTFRSRIIFLSISPDAAAEVCFPDSNNETPKSGGSCAYVPPFVELVNSDWLK
jgi:hypothetical protein